MYPNEVLHYSQRAKGMGMYSFFQNCFGFAMSYGFSIVLADLQWKVCVPTPIKTYDIDAAARHTLSSSALMVSPFMPRGSGSQNSDTFHLRKLILYSRRTVHAL